MLILRLSKTQVGTHRSSGVNQETCPHRLRRNRRGQASLLDPYRVRLAAPNGEGFNVELKALPVNGRIVLMPPKAEDSTGAEVAR